MTLEISPFRQKEVVMKLLVKSPTSWAEPTVLLRFLSPTSKQYCCYLSGVETGNAAATMEVGRFYLITVPPKCVKANDTGCEKYYGIPDTTSIRFKFPMKFQLASVEDSSNFKGTLAYNFLSFEHLEQKEDGSFVDLLGCITHVDASDINNNLPKAVVTLAYGDFFERIECLGNHARLGFAEKQVLACKGLAVRSYKGNRACATTLLSYLVLNPHSSVGRVPEPSDHESPRKKATLSKTGQTLSY